jgi:peptidyl-prolyl cis-trans isomerase B (cyclophilin B)
MDEAAALAVDNTALAAVQTLEAKKPTFTIVMNDGSVMYGELYPEIAPETVGNFVSLAGEGFYDNLIFHRVIAGFMIQGGDPKGDGTGGPGYAIKGEFANNGVENDLSHVRGVISMARSRSYNSASSQFFIVHQDATYLDGQYAAFGRVVEGMDVVDAIAEVSTDGNDRPLTEQVIGTVRVVEG